MDIQKRIITNPSKFMAGRNNQTISFIVLHTFDGPGDDLYNWFQNASPGTSAHFSVQFDGSVKQYVEVANTAYHAGHVNMNVQSIGIEHMDNGNPNDTKRTEALYESSAQLVAKLAKEHNIPVTRQRIVTHREAFMHEYGYTPSFTCSAGLDIERIFKRVQQILAPSWQEEWQASNEKFDVKKSYNLYEVDTGKIVKSLDPGALETHYKKDDWRMTKYSYDAKIKNAFKLSEIATSCEQKLTEANREIDSLHKEKAALQKKLDDIKLIVKS